MKLTDNQDKILSVLQHGYGGEFCYNYDQLEYETALTRTVLKEEIKILKELGIVQYVRGLMTEDGEVAGSGFTIYYNKMRELEGLLTH